MPSTEYRHMRSGSLSIASPNGHAPPVMGPLPPSTQRFEGPRSPPNTSHVPCKFYRQGACQAGNACPFSHDLGASAETVCKYFAKVLGLGSQCKEAPRGGDHRDDPASFPFQINGPPTLHCPSGNCKFGPKCANIHVLPDGRRINYGKNGVTIGAVPIGLAGRTNPTAPTTTAYNHAATTTTTTTTSALTSGLYHDGVPPYTPTYPYPENRQPHQLGRQPSLENGLPSADAAAYSLAGSTYGSPRDDDPSRLGLLALSPVNGNGNGNGKTLSVLDAPLPASFDSQGISNAARYPAAPWPSSVPSKFGIDSPSPSLSSAKDTRTSDTLKSLHNSAFGGSEYLSTSSAAAGTSPPSAPVGLGEEYFGRRPMHSSRYARPKMMSSSLPKPTVDRDWDAEFAFYEEDYLPQNLQDLLTPAEKARRGSLRAADAEFGGENAVKFGSPMAGASPSRWGPLFQRQKEEELDAGRTTNKRAPSAFGHVGSPLRNSVLSNGMGNGSSGLVGVGSISSRTTPGSRSGSDSASALTQQLQRTRLLGDDSLNNNSPRLHPMMAVGRTPGNGAIGPVGRERERAMERHVSSGSIGSSGRFTTPVDEEDPAFVFSMEEDGDEQQSARQRKRASSGLGVAGTGWSYAGVLSGKTTSTSGSGLAKESREPSVTVETVGGR
ncbi:hypothetical protein SODALDRAFT_174317 [Sodiomyces alkalinus F11]|uniref:C3H1-type domain-containing protein n=1 Tax=Sodiomyces alkalinus (strain CBS 110278 / VKM F-3762 / F11) TaxID=1314773 RepID=A0A3N2PTF2_SODAK|nr:hypothetical protein SODALDRAFT_174317 [Sodiomyces alkalinus F11]ROT37787.1 hypothetical protein SODALDRAFT_174317 [Sodiomyces alkalinus F11]